MNKVKFSREELDILYLPERVSADKVAEKIRLDSRSNVLDRVDLGLTPYLIAPMQLIGKSRVTWIYLIAPTQSGKTLFLQTAVADSIDQDPGTLIYILPDEKSGKKALKEKVVSLIEENPFLNKHKTGSRLSLESIHLDNMSIYPGWSGSLASLSSTPAKRVILDEIRLMKLTIGEESNAIKLAADRLTTYLQMGLGQGYGVSTPSVEGDLLHQQLSVFGTTILHWAYVCKKCKHMEILDFFENIKFNKEEKRVVCVCSSCGNEYKDTDMKREMNTQGLYVKKSNDDSGSLEAVNLEELSGRVVFWYDSIASPFRSFKAIFNEFLQTKDKMHDYKNFTQAWLARFWVDDISQTTVLKLKETIIDDAKGIVPKWCQFLTAGVDSQGNGFYVTVYAWGYGRRTRLIDEFFIDCPVSTAMAEDVEKLFRREIEDKYYRDVDGKAWTVALWAIDTGGNRTKQIYDACSSLERVIMVKGKNNQNITISYNSKINLYLIRTTEYLDETEERASLTNGSYELPKNVSPDFLNQFVNVRKVRKQNKQTGEHTIIWKKIGQDDYRMAAVHAFICLDIPTSLGTLRREVENKKFSYNPLVKKIEETVEDNGSVEVDEYYEEIDNSYDIGEMEGW